MSETTPNTPEATASTAPNTPPSAGGEDLDARIASAVAEALKPISQQLQALQAGPSASPEAIEKAVADRLAAQNAQQANRQAMIDKITQDKLGGNKGLSDLLVGNTEAELSASADRVFAAFKKSLPDFGVIRDTGASPNQQEPTHTESPSRYISEGLSAARSARATALPVAEATAPPQ